MLDINNPNLTLLLSAMVVLAGLILLVGITALYKAGKMRQEAPAAPAAAAPAPTAAPAAPGAPSQDAALVAAITAAISCFLEQEAPEGAAPQGFIVRRIRRVN